MRKKGLPSGAPGSPQDPLRAVPQALPGVEPLTGPDGLVHLRRTSSPGGLLGLLTRGWLDLSRQVTISLDHQGSQFWEQIDGRRDLEQIASRLQAQWDLDPQACRQATIQFTRSLMLRGLIGLKTKG